ncbi:spondin-2-like [Polyodon spathula]|uniref:spondin-2-like n=1 Tax=Polyodon spathula TaxID=7913 RepID=UPI001B7EDF5C|nr:spondin-2-like [Polyodon spathula]
MSAELLPPNWLQMTLAVMLWLSCGRALQQANQTACTARSPATYILVFTGHRNPTTFPKQYPMFRPPAQWSKLIAVSHSNRFHLWQEGSLASQGVQMFAERGVTVALIKEIKEVKKSMRSVHGVYRAPGISNGIGHTSTELHMQPRSPRLSLMGKIVSSPDWFVGVDSLDLCEGGQWVQEVSLNLYPYDVGTDSGFTFSSPNYLTVPQENITQITSQNPNHPANSFYYPKLAKLPPLARVTLTRQTGHSPRHKQFSNHILREAGSKCYSETPLDCEVSRWSSWGLCLEKCGRPGTRHRTRYILLQPANSGTACPDLEEGETCSSDNCI